MFVGASSNLTKALLVEPKDCAGRAAGGEVVKAFGENTETDDCIYDATATPVP